MFSSDRFFFASHVHIFKIVWFASFLSTTSSFSSSVFFFVVVGVWFSFSFPTVWASFSIDTSHRPKMFSQLENAHARTFNVSVIYTRTMRVNSQSQNPGNAISETCHFKLTFAVPWLALSLSFVFKFFNFIFLFPLFALTCHVFSSGAAFHSRLYLYALQKASANEMYTIKNEQRYSRDEFRAVNEWKRTEKKTRERERRIKNMHTSTITNITTLKTTIELQFMVLHVEISSTKWQKPAYISSMGKNTAKRARGRKRERKCFMLWRFFYLNKMK